MSNNLTEDDPQSNLGRQWRLDGSARVGRLCTRAHRGKAAYPRFNGKGMNEGTLTVLNTAMDHRPSEFRRHTCHRFTPALLPISVPRNLPKTRPKTRPKARPKQSSPQDL